MLPEDLRVSPKSVPECALMAVVHHVGVSHGCLDPLMPSERLSGCTAWPFELHLAFLSRLDCFWTSKSKRMCLQRRSDYRLKAGHNMFCQLGSLALALVWPAILATACPGRSSCPGLGNCPGPQPRPGLSIRPGSVSCPDWSLSLAFGLHLDARTNGEFNKLLAYFRTDCKVQHN